MGHDHQGYGALVGLVVAGVVLDEAGDADASFAQDLRQLGEHARPVGDGEPEIIARLDLTGGCERRSAASARAAVRSTGPAAWRGR